MKDDEHVNPHTGKTESGWWCNVCQLVGSFVHLKRSLTDFIVMVVCHCEIVFSKAQYPHCALMSLGTLIQSIFCILTLIYVHPCSKYKTHFIVYEKKCWEQGITMNPHALPSGE